MTTSPLPVPSPSSASPRPRHRRRRALFAIPLLLLTLLVAEGLARLVTSPVPQIYQAHPHLRHVRTPGSSHPLLGLDEDHDWTRPFVFGVDEHGFRKSGPALAPPGAPKPEGVYRVFFVGASTTENVAVPDEETYPALVVSALRERTQRDVRGANTAIAGNRIADSFALVAQRVLAMEPDAIVVLHGINDMRATLSDRFDPTHFSDRQKPPKLRVGDVAARWFRLVDLVERAKDRLTRRSHADRYRERLRGMPLTPDDAVDPAVGLPYFERYVRMLAAVCRQADVPLLLCAQPSLYHAQLTEAERATLWMGYVNHGELNLSPATLERGMQLYNDALRRIAAEEGCVFVDVAAAVPRDLDHFYDDCHYTRQGNVAVAAAVSEALLAGGLPGIDRPAWSR